MNTLTIGDLTLMDAGERLRLRVDERQDTTTLTRAGARLAIGWMLGWIRQQQGSHEDVLDKTLRQLLEALR